MTTAIGGPIFPRPEGLSLPATQTDPGTTDMDGGIGGFTATIRFPAPFDVPDWLTASGDALQPLPADETVDHATSDPPDIGQFADSFVFAKDNVMMEPVVVVTVAAGNQTITGTPGPDTLDGGAGHDLINGLQGDDRINGMGGDDTINAGDGADTVIGGDGADVIEGGASSADLRDVVFGGAGDDLVNGGYGNDSLVGDAGDDTIEGGFGVDTVIGNDGDDQLTGSAWSDAIFGGNGNDFLNGGFGFDRLNGGAGSDRFYHVGVQGHGSDWIQDYDFMENDILQSGIVGSNGSDYQVNYALTPGAGDGNIGEAFVIYIPTRQILWALVDGADEANIFLQADGQVFDLLA